jgi:hypothetical protein
MGILIPDTYKCRTHQRDLTEQVKTLVEADDDPVAGFGFGRSLRRRERAFKILVRCPEDNGHDLMFSGSYRR